MQHMIWIEAEAFAELGGWAIETQFIDQMGSAYLMADGMCTPVADAAHTVSVPQGQYTVWARTCDWLPEYHPGRFRLIVNGVAGNPLGASGMSGWHWEKAGTWALGGDATLLLCDETGAYGRIDALLLTADAAFAPNDCDTESLRDRLRGQAAIPRARYDVAVIGGGLAGCTAAVTAARNGAKVALVEARPVLGGNGSTEYLIPPCGHWNADEPGTDDRVTASEWNARETGVVEEYRTSGYQRIREGMLYSGRLQKMIEDEPDVVWLSGLHARRAIVTGGRIEAAECVDVRTGRLSRIEAEAFIDCSGDSQFAVSAGAQYRQGRESRAAHGEPWGADEDSPHTMGNGIKFLTMETTEEQPFAAPAWAYRFESCDAMDRVRHPSAYGAIGRPDCTDPLAALTHQWLLELGGTRDAFWDAESIRDDLLRLIFGLWDHVKNHCPEEKDRARNMMLRWVGTFAGKRETRRLIGDVILTQNDICDNTRFPDAVAYGAWVVDDHYSDGFFHKGKAGKHYDDFEHAAYGKIYGVPLRALYSVNVPNLWMAGRNISATHLAMSNARVMLICAVIGQAAGTAAAVGVRDGLDARETAATRIDEIQTLLCDQGAYIPGRAYISPDNLAATASFEASGQANSPKAVLLDGVARAVGQDAHAWTPMSGAPHRLTLRWEKPVSVNFVELIFQTRDLAPDGFRIDGFLNGAPVFSMRGEGKKARRETLTLDAAATIDVLTLTLSDPAPLCQIDVRKKTDDALAVARRVQRNVKQKDAIPVLPWEGSRGRRAERV